MTRAELKRLGFRLDIEKDATGAGHEYVINDAQGRTVCCGWSMGNRREATEDALKDLKQTLARHAAEKGAAQ